MRRLKFKSKKAFLSLTIFTFSFVLNGNINIADGNDLKKYLWKNRVILFFSKDKNNILYKEQKKEFSNIKQETEKRDLIFIEISENINSKHKAVVSSGSQLYVIPSVAQTNINPTHILAFENHHSKEEKIQIKKASTKTEKPKSKATKPLKAKKVSKK